MIKMMLFSCIMLLAGLNTMLKKHG